MKKVFYCLILILIMVFSLYSSAFACTSFAEYSDKILYGMNFDYPDTPIRLNFFNQNGLKIFYGQFQEGELYPMFVAVTNKGLFIPTQIQYPSLPAQKSLNSNEIYIGDLPSKVLSFDHIFQVRDMLASNRLAPTTYPIHMMLADKYGDAVICEVGKGKNELVDIKDKFLVMTNFKVSDFRDKPYTDVFGGGADRYKTACETIEKNLEGFNIDTGWDVLKKTVQTNPSCETLMSSLFDPKENVVYFSLRRDFSKVWKVSIDNGTIETYKGFDKSYVIKIPENGILSTVLMDEKLIQQAQELVKDIENPSKDKLLIVMGVTCFLVLPSVFLIRKKSVITKNKGRRFK
ncbi:MAG: hypothetical protein N2376_10895 [Clostridia bacterium]|nr:hypothetical protein [Clostridia bacterium]